MEELKLCQFLTFLLTPPDPSARPANMAGASLAGLLHATLTDPGGLRLPQGRIQVIPNIAASTL